MTKHNPLAAEHFHAVDAMTVRQTIEETRLDYSIDMGAFTIHHGSRQGAPVVIVEHHNQQPNELSGIWFAESLSTNGSPE